MPYPRTTIAAVALLAVPVAAGPATPSPQPGNWRITRTFVDIALPGIPADAIGPRLGVPRVWRQCIAPAAVGRLYDNLLGECRGERKLSPDGRLHMAGTCGGDRLEFAGMAAPRRIVGIMTKRGRDGSHIKAQLTLDGIGGC